MLKEADNVDLKMLLNRQKLKTADVKTNKELQSKGMRFSTVDSDDVDDGVSLEIPPVRPSMFETVIDPYDHVYAAVGRGYCMFHCWYYYFMCVTTSSLRDTRV